MKRYNSTPNRLSHTSCKIPSSKRYTTNYFPSIFVLAIVFIIILVVYKSCYDNTTLQQTKSENNVTIDKQIPEGNNNPKKVPHNKLKIPSDSNPRDLLPPETNLKILTDEH